jgi:DNA repair exonuclease SbcCD nuclease subunit
VTYRFWSFVIVKFIHTSDWHLGMQAHFLPEEARPRFLEDRFEAVRRIGAIAAEEGCSFVVVAGDVFDSNHVDDQVLAKATDALSSFTVPMFLLPGNHDASDPSSVYRRDAWTAHKPANAVVLEEAVVVSVSGVQNVEVVGAPWHSRRPLADPLGPAYDVPASVEGAMRVVVGHGVVDELSPDRDDPALIRVPGITEVLQGGKAHYVALGDRHSVTEIAGCDGRAHYSGAPVSTNYGEKDPNQILIVALEGEECAVERRRVGAWRFERASRDLNGEDDVTALGDWLDAFDSKHTTVVKLSLRGTLTLAASAMLEEMLERKRLTFASLNNWERQSDLVVAPDDADLATLDVSGYVREAFDELRERAVGPDEDAMVTRDALNLLYRLAR